MNRLPASVHRSIDMLSIVVFLAAPLLLRMSGPPAMVSYALAAVHLIVTLATQFPDMHHRPLPLRIHGIIEVVVALVLIALPWFVGWTDTARTYYVTIGVLLLVVWALSNYGRQYGAERGQRAHANADRG